MTDNKGRMHPETDAYLAAVADLNKLAAQALDGLEADGRRQGCPIGVKLDRLLMHAFNTGREYQRKSDDMAARHADEVAP